MGRIQFDSGSGTEPVSGTVPAGFIALEVQLSLCFDELNFDQFCEAEVSFSVSVIS